MAGLPRVRTRWLLSLDVKEHDVDIIVWMEGSHEKVQKHEDWHSSILSKGNFLSRTVHTVGSLLPLKGIGG